MLSLIFINNPEKNALLEKEMVTHSSILAWESPWNVASYSPLGHKRVGWDLATDHIHFPEAGGGVKAQMRGHSKEIEH